MTSSKFKPGDTVVATWDFLAAGGLAEYALVDPKLAALRPPSLSSVEGSALANSAGHASMAVKNAGVKKGDRVLILGGSGGLGTAFVQFAR